MKIIEADLTTPEHQRDVLTMTAAYAEDPMGNGGPLPSDVLERLIAGLREHPTTLIFLAYADEVVVGIATCFVGFSTFTARPLINIHDLAVLPEYQGHGIGRSLLEAVQRGARERGCARVTLEVLENNPRAKHLYEAAGFGPTVSNETQQRSLFYTKSL